MLSLLARMRRLLELLRRLVSKTRDNRHPSPCRLTWQLLAPEETGDSTSETESSRTSEETAEATNTDDEDEETSARDQNTARPTQSGTRTGTRTSEPTRTKFDPNDYPAGVKMVTPDTTIVATALYKIGDNVELGWNYTSLQGTPTAIDVLVSCSVASETWTLTSNMTFETSVNFLWDTNDQADAVESPLLTEMYTLIIKDSEAEISDRPEPGYLGSYQGFTFGLYRPAAYTPLSEWECTACNAGPGGFDGQAIKLAIVMSFITICSFTWFVTGLGLE